MNLAYIWLDSTLTYVDGLTWVNELDMILECVNLCFCRQSASEQKCKKHTKGNKRLPRRPASSKDLPALTDSYVLQVTKASSLQQVFWYSKLHICTQLEKVIYKCDITHSYL